MSFYIFKKNKWPQRIYLLDPHDFGEQFGGVKVRVYTKARNYRLSISAAGEPVLSVPARGNVKDAEGFLNKHRNWLARGLKNRPKPVPFVDGAKFPLRAEIHQIAATGKLRGQVEIRHHFEEKNFEIPHIIVPGGKEHMARRLKDWLKKQAFNDLEAASNFHAQRLGVSPASIHIKGQSSRWGSCSSAGRLNYNWRLIMAPGFVLDYVAAHEVAHLCEMNHSPTFWEKVKLTLPDMENGRDWLKANGNQLMAYGGDKGVQK